MANVIYIDDIYKGSKVEFTHYMDSVTGWRNATCQPSYYEKFIYLGKCIVSGDMFCAYSNGCVTIYKGNLNSGEY